MVKSESGSKKIFYVEKGEFLRSMMEFALKPKGASVYTVGTLENNFYLLDDLLPDLIIFDVKTVQNHLEDLRPYGEKAILVATGDEDDRPLVEGMVKAFLVKPLEAKSIASRVLALVD